MRRTVAAAAVAAGLVAPVAADEHGDLLARIDALPFHVGSMVWRVIDCGRSAVRAAAMRPEPKITDADWRPNSARPTVEQEVADALASCSIEAEALAGALTPTEIEAITASITRDAMAVFKRAREERDEGGVIRWAPDWDGPKR